jgi:hypothetical protein
MKVKKDLQIDKIKKILSDKFLASDQTALCEENTDAQGKPFRMNRTIISSSEIEYVLYKFDAAKTDIFPYFKDKSIEGLKKICDYVLFAEFGRSVYILLIELKLGTESAQEQLNATTLFVEYILKNAERVKHQIQDYHIRKIRISEIKSKGKRVTKTKDLEYDANAYLEYNTVKDFRIRELVR